MPLAGHGLRPTPLRRRASRPQLKRDPLGGCTETTSMDIQYELTVDDYVAFADYHHAHSSITGRTVRRWRYGIPIAWLLVAFLDAAANGLGISSVVWASGALLWFWLWPPFHRRLVRRNMRRFATQGLTRGSVGHHGQREEDRREGPRARDAAYRGLLHGVSGPKVPRLALEPTENGRVRGTARTGALVNGRPIRLWPVALIEAS